MQRRQKSEPKSRYPWSDNYLHFTYNLAIFNRSIFVDGCSLFFLSIRVLDSEYESAVYLVNLEFIQCQLAAADARAPVSVLE